MTLQMALKQLRAEMNINQKTLAQLVGIDATTLNRWEKGRIKPQRVSALLLLNFAKSKGVSEECQNALHDALFPNYKIETEVNDLRTTEISKINGMVNDSSNGVIVIDMDTFEILYANNKMLKMENRLLEEAKSLKCYQFLLHSEERCADCLQYCGGRDRYTEMEYHSPRTGGHYLVRSKEVLWSGKIAQIKYITDITEMQKMKEEADYLRESLHIAASQAKMAVFLYDISNHRARLISRDENHQEIPELIENFPQVIYDGDQIDPACMDDYREMIRHIERGQAHAEAVVKVKLDRGVFHWTRFQMHLVKSGENGKPEMAVCSVTEIDREKSLERRIRFEQRLLDAMILASRIYHYDAFGLISLNNGQLTKVHYVQKEKTHTTETLSYEEEAALLIEKFICQEDRPIREPYLKLKRIRKELEEKELISLMYRIKMQDGTTHRMLERISWYDREDNVCFISILDVDKTEADIN